jgi:hypothetical protein
MKFMLKFLENIVNTVEIFADASIVGWILWIA